MKNEPRALIMSFVSFQRTTHLDGCHNIFFFLTNTARAVLKIFFDFKHNEFFFFFDKGFPFALVKKVKGKSARSCKYLTPRKYTIALGLLRIIGNSSPASAKQVSFYKIFIPPIS